MIEEASVAKVALNSRADAHPRICLLAARAIVRDALELYPVIKPPTKEDVEDARKNNYCDVAQAPMWMLRQVPSADAAAACANEAAAAAGVDGLTLAQRGLLGVVLCLLMLEPAKAMREDRLWATLRELDPERFALTEAKRGAWGVGAGARASGRARYAHPPPPASPRFAPRSTRQRGAGVSG